MVIDIQSNLSYPDSCYPGTSLNRAADSLYFMLILQKLWAVQWVWPIIAYTFVLYSEIRTTLSYGYPLIPRRPDKRGFTVPTLVIDIPALVDSSDLHSRGPVILIDMPIWQMRVVIMVSGVRVTVTDTLFLSLLTRHG